MIEIRTQRLVLRRARPDDVDAVHAIMSDAAVMQYWSTPPHSERAETERWLDSMIAADPTQSDDFILTMNGRPIGKLGAWKLPEVGFLLAREMWGQGLASEAMTAFIEHRRRAGSARLTADVDPRNAPCLRFLDRHGFLESRRAERTWLVGDEWCDSVYLSLTL
jgi:ribosomal-protein-alanine N-acetyltransferase